ncbi:hypothetical protein [Pseudoalteromonas denitrificans]|nr:hypothetical protein [Pseudoalteromonas denitrificans]
MLKKSLLALAVSAAAFSGAVNAAAVITGFTPAVVALEGHQNTTIGNNKLDEVNMIGGADTIIVTAGTAYIVNDLVYVSVSGATFDTTIPPTFAFTTAGTGTANFVDFSDANTARFRIATADWAAADLLTITGFDLKTTGATTATNIKFGAKAVSVNPLIGDYDKAVDLSAFTFANQLSNVITPLNAEVSTGAGRAEFTTTGGHATLQDVLTVATTDTPTAVDSILVTKVTHVLTGNYSWVMDYDLAANGGDADGVMDAAEIAKAFTTTLGAPALGADNVVYTLNTALTTLTATHNVVGGVLNTSSGIDASVALQLNAVGNAKSGSTIFAPQSFALNTTVSNGTISYSLPEVTGGKFTLDGSTTNVAFMPYGANYAQSITVSNRGSVVGAITVDIFADGVKHSKVLTATSAANSVTNISTEVKDFVAEKFGATFEGNVSLSIVTNSPSVEATALYYAKSDADRVLVQSK